MIKPFNGKHPRIHPSSYIAPTAVVIGDVSVGEESSIWFYTVVRGDVNLVRIGHRSNVQDGSVLHVDSQGPPVIIGDEVTVGHRAVLHGCTVGNGALIGIGAVVLDEAEIGEESIIGAAAVVPPGTKVPPRTLMLGVPVKPARQVSADELRWMERLWQEYVKDAHRYRELDR